MDHKKNILREIESTQHRKEPKCLSCGSRGFENRSCPSCNWTLKVQKIRKKVRRKVL